MTILGLGPLELVILAIIAFFLMGRLREVVRAFERGLRGGGPPFNFGAIPVDDQP